jgi:hypothetical protein
MNIYNTDAKGRKTKRISPFYDIAVWRGLTRQMSRMKDLGSGEQGVGWTRR